MAVVTATQSRTEERDVYVPATQEGMAHRSYLSPDQKWVLVAAEMDMVGNKPCRLVPFDGSSAGRIVGPKDSECSSAAWSMNGKWMFFSAATNHGFHLWRQKFPDGEPEQITSGPTEEEGIAVAPDGHSLLTSVGLAGGTVWVHDRSGEHRVLFEGQARLMVPQFSSRAVFSPEGSRIFFLGRRNPNEPEELWYEDLNSGSAERPVPGMTIAHSYDVSPDGKHIVFDSYDAQGVGGLWVASLDRRQPPRRLESKFPETYAVFGPKGGLFFQRQEGDTSYLYRRDLDTGAAVRVIPTPIVRLHTISPDGKWIVAEMPVTGDNTTRGLVA
jgi:Tol biopolymer transport system component